MISKGIYPVVYLIFETSFYQMFLHFMENGFGLNLAIPHCKWALFPALVNIIKIAASHSCPHSTYPSLSLFIWRPKAESSLQFPVSAIVTHSVAGRLSMNSPTFLWPIVFIRTMAPIRETVHLERTRISSKNTTTSNFPVTHVDVKQHQASMTTAAAAASGSTGTASSSYESCIRGFVGAT